MRVTVDANPFPAFAKYSFGSQEERKDFEPPLITLDGAGNRRQRQVAPRMGRRPVKDTPLPLRAQLTARVFEPGGGRATKTDKVAADAHPRRLSRHPPDLRGPLRPRGHRHRIRHRGASMPRASRSRGRASSTASSGSTMTISGTRSTAAGAGRASPTSALVDCRHDRAQGRRAGAPRQRLSWGAAPPHRHRPARTTPRPARRFYVGWYGGSRSAEETPDTLARGERQARTTRRATPPAAHRGAVRRRGDDRHRHRPHRQHATTSQVPAGGTTVDVPVKAEWGAGAYALVTAWRPLAAPAERTPTRAIGAAWLGLDPALRTLAVQIAAPEKMTPRQRIEVPVRVANLQGEEAFVTLAAVDEGILQLTRFRTPNPADYYFGKRQLGVAMRDDYGRLLDGRADDLGRIRAGGDAGDIGGLDIVPTRTVALFSGPVKLDAKGEAKIALEIPDFIGQLRLMAVAYDKSQVGSAEQRLFVRDAVTADVVLPRFLAPNDSGRAGAVAAQCRGPGRRLSRDAGGDRRGVARTAGRRDAAARRRPARAADLAAERRRRSASARSRSRSAGPGNFAVRREWDIQVRAAQTPSAVDTVSQLEPCARTDGRPQRHGALRRRHRAGRRGAVAHARHRRAGPAARARQVPLRLHRADDQPRLAVALLQRRGAARATGRPIHDRRPRAGRGLPHRRHADAPTARSACGARSPRPPPNGCRATRSTSCCAPATSRWRCRRRRCSAG